MLTKQWIVRGGSEHENRNKKRIDYGTHTNS